MESSISFLYTFNIEVMNMRINFIRHSTTRANEEGRISGARVDLPLSPKGIKIIEDLKAQGIYPEDPGVIYASALKRAAETIQIIYPGREVHRDAGLNERDFGDLETMSKEDADRYVREHFITDDSEQEEDLNNAPPNGESTRQVADRSKKVFRRLVKEFREKGYETVTICGHGAYLRDFAFAYGLPVLGEIKSDRYLDNGKGFTLEVDDSEDPKIKVVGYIGGETARDVLIDYVNRYKEKE